MTAPPNSQTLLRSADLEQILGLLRETGWFAKQTDDEGLSACLLSLLAALNWSGTVRDVCDALPGYGARIGLLDLLNTMASCGYVGRRARIRLDDLDDRLLPCLFQPEDGKGHAGGYMVVLNKGDGDSAQISAYCGRSESIVTIDVGSKVIGTVHLFERVHDNGEDEESASAKLGDFTWFRAQLERFRSLFRQILLTSVVLNLLSLSAPLFLMLVYDKIVTAQAVRDLYYILIGVVLAIAAETALRYLRLRSTTWLGARIDYIVSVAIFERLTALQLRFTERASVAAQLARIKSFDSVREFFTGPLFLLALDLPFSIILLVAIAMIGGPLVIIPIISILIYGVMALFFRPRLKRAVRVAARASSARHQLLVETFGKMDALRFSGMNEVWYEHLREKSGDASYASFRSSFLSAVIESLSHGLVVLSGVATIAVGIELVLVNELTVGGLVAALILTWRSLGPLQTICTMLPRLEQLRNSIAQVNRLMDLDPEQRSHTEQRTTKAFKGHVTLSNVGLRYSRHSDPVFAGLSIDAQPGQLIALTGSNGAGKSTILKLINRLYAPQAGSIRIDGADIRQIDPIELRRQIAYIPESPDFFTGTIEENFRLIFPFITKEKLREALVRVGAWDDLMALPAGLGTVIGRGRKGSLPSGLAYRLNLARAFISDSSIMLFDELPYSVLNSSTGEAFKQFLSESRGRRTIFMVTHRDDYVRMADQVVVLKEDGRPRVLTKQAKGSQERAA